MTRKPLKNYSGFRRRMATVELFLPTAEEEAMVASYIYSALALFGRGLDREHRLHHGILVKSIKIGTRVYESTTKENT